MMMKKMALAISVQLVVNAKKIFVNPARKAILIRIMIQKQFPA